MISQMGLDPFSLIRRHDFVTQLASGLDRCGVTGGDRLLLAVSGGADSVALLRGCCALAGRKPWEIDLHVGHVNHHLRSEAQGDEQFVEQLCQSLGVPFHQRDIDPSGQPGNLEAAAREQRYAALADIAQQIDADAIVTAHHADDQLETLLMRMMRGSSIEGMAGIRPVRKLGRRPLIRPMLQTPHACAQNLLVIVGQDWREDHTNADLNRTRARLRAKVLPELLAMRPDANTQAARTADQLQHARRLVRHAIARAFRHHVNHCGGVSVSREALRGMDPLIRTGVIRYMCRVAGAGSDRLGRALLLIIAEAACDSSNEIRQWDLPVRQVARLDGELLRIHRPDH